MKYYKVILDYYNGSHTRQAYLEAEDFDNLVDKIFSVPFKCESFSYEEISQKQYDRYFDKGRTQMGNLILI